MAQGSQRTAGGRSLSLGLHGDPRIPRRSLFEAHDSLMHGDSIDARPTFPEWIEPMAATLTQERFIGPEWTFERKIDGIRLIAFKQGPDVRLYSRTRHLQQLPTIAAAIARLPVRDAILDGELTWERDGGTYHLFDLIWLDGRDLKGERLPARRAQLAA